MRAIQRNSEPNIPNLFVAGAPKCGTTSLFELLQSHVDIVGTTVKETGFFLLDNEYSKGTEFFTKTYAPREPRGRYLLDATPWYMYSPVALQRISASSPDSRFIVIFRDPVERAVSSYSDALLTGRDAREMREALDPRIASRPGRSDRVGPLDHLWASRFEEYMPGMLATAGDRLLVLPFTALHQHDGQALHGRLADFLSVDARGFPSSTPWKNRARSVRSPALGRLLRGDLPLARMGSKLIPRRAIRRVAHAASEWNARPARSGIAALRVEDVPPSLLREIQTFFEPTYKYLEELPGYR